MEEVLLTQEKSFQIELSSDKNNSYSLEFKFILNNYIEIISNQIKNIINKSFSSKYSFEEIRENAANLVVFLLQNIQNF